MSGRREVLRRRAGAMGVALVGGAATRCGSGAVVADRTLPAVPDGTIPAGADAAMRVAVEPARQAEWPFGAALLDPATGAVVHAAHDTTGTGDPTAHAEVNVLRQAGLDGTRSPVARHDGRVVPDVRGRRGVGRHEAGWRRLMEAFFATGSPQAVPFEYQVF